MSSPYQYVRACWTLLFCSSVVDVDTTVTPSMVEEGENASVCVTILPPATLEREVSILVMAEPFSTYDITLPTYHAQSANVPQLHELDTVA